MLYTAETFPTGFAVVPTVPPWSMFPHMRLSFPRKQRRRAQQYGQREKVMSTSYSPATPSSIRTTSTPSSGHHHSRCDFFHKRILNPSQHEATAYGHSKLSTQPTLTGEALPTNPKVVNSVTDARIPLSESIPRVTADWHRNADILQNCPARPYATLYA